MHYLVYNLSQAQTELLPEHGLDATERAAYARRGARYLLERSLLKNELARLCKRPAADIRFTYSDNGKPLFPEAPFNLSHSGDLLCIAFHSGAVGVDIEQERPRLRPDELARRIMCPEQFAAWQERQSPLGEFYDCWCAAEALAKHCGDSIWQARQRPFLRQASGILPLYEGAPRIELFSPHASAAYHGAIAYSE